MKKFGFFNSINGDRKYLASDIADAFDIGITTGLKSEEGNLEVVPYQNMQVKIKPGGAMIFGHFYLNDEDEIIDIDLADGELDRIDRVVLRYDKYERSIKTLVIKGIPALTPTPPAALRTNEQFDLVLADIYVRKATTEILVSDITDMRESDLCGYIGVKGAVTNLEFERVVKRLNRVPFTFTPLSGYKITNSVCFTIDDIAHVSLEIQKTDETVFEQQRHSVATSPFVPNAVYFTPLPTVSMTGSQIDQSMGNSRVLKTKVLALDVDKPNIKNIYISGLFPIVEGV